MTEPLEPPEEWALAAEYALGLLPADEARAFETAMAQDPALREDYAYWAEHYATLTEDIPPVAPPRQLWGRISDAAFSQAEKASFWARFGIMSALGGGLLAALAVLWVIDLSGVMRWLDEPDFTARIAAEDDSLIVQASLDRADNLLRLTRATGAAPGGRVLELWLIAGSDAPVSLGVLPEAQTVEIALEPALADLFGGAVLALSEEPPGGSPTGAPTGAVLAVGPVTEI